jgi:hypothetical protein
LASGNGNINQFGFSKFIRKRTRIKGSFNFSLRPTIRFHFVSTSLIDRLVKTHHSSNHQITATSYLDTVGVPAIFSDRYFPELLKLDADTGASRIIQKYLPETYIIDFPQGAIDLDTPDRY